MDTNWSSDADTTPPATKPAFRVPFVIVGLVIGSVMAVAAVYLLMVALPERALHAEYAMHSKISVDMSGLDLALDSWAENHGGAYPSTLDALLRSDAHSGAVLVELPRDPWDRPYVYEPPSKQGERPVVLSYGRDGKPGGDDDDTDFDDRSLRSR